MRKIDEIRARCAEATPGPWNYDERIGGVAVYYGNRVNCIVDSEGRRLYYKNGHFDKKTGWTIDAQSCHDAHFVAHSREDIPWLLAEVERLQAENAALERERDALLQAVESMTSIIREAAADRCDYCTLQTEPCMSRGLNATCCFEWHGPQDAGESEVAACSKTPPGYAPA